jgi:ElaB/YqjD/DUF883 family membrane-anchored ribosome-binding protein
MAHALHNYCMNEISESFPRTRQDLSNLKKTAVDAAREIGDTATVHAKTAQNHLQELASHAQKEGGDQLDQVKGRVRDFGDKARDYIALRPLASIGIALATGFLLGIARRGRSRGK